MASLELGLVGLRFRNPGGGDEAAYRREGVAGGNLEWDSVVRSTHPVNCWYNQSCLFNLYIKDGVVVREEQVGIYPAPRDPQVPDLNPRGCQKGVCYSHRMYDPTRLRYPLKRSDGSERGAGQWQRVSWEEALTEIADHIVDVLITEGNDAIIRLGGTQGAGPGASDGLSMSNLLTALGIPSANITTDDADEHPGAALTWGKIAVCDSADNWFHADLIFIWGGNPSYTHIANFHYIPEARYSGTKVVAITPDFNPSCPFADQWVPINLGTDAALALGMAQVIISRGLYRGEFLREQTDLPLLVRRDNGKFLTQKEMQRGGRENVFYLFDERSHRVVEAPWRSLALDGVVPALEGEYEVSTLGGRVRVRSVFEVLKEHLRGYTPEKASAITGVSPGVIEQLAVEFARARGVVNITTANWGKHYHGDLMQRAQILLWALCGHFGRKGATYNAYPVLAADTGIFYLQRRGAEALLTAEATDPRFAQWREQGYTDEMVLYEYMAEAVAQHRLINPAFLYYFHGGLREMAEKHNSWDPYLKRPVAAYVAEALERGWQFVTPRLGKEPKVLLEGGGSFLRRSRASGELVKNLLPKLRLLVTIDWRMGSTALYSDFVLPTAGWYEKFSVRGGMPQCPYLHLSNKAVEPVGEAKTEWEIWCLLARKIQDRAQARGVSSFVDRNGRERRLDNLYDLATTQGLYAEGEEEAVARDFFSNIANVERMEWEEFKATGLAGFTAIPKVLPSSACDLQPGEPIVPLTWHTGVRKQPYPTQTRRMQFYIDHDWFLELGEALPTHKDIPKMGGDYPFQITGGHARWSIHSCWKDSPLLLRLQRGEPIVFMNSQDAQARGISDGDLVTIFNDVATTQMQASVSPAVRRGQVIIYHDWENFQFQGKNHFKSLMPSPLNPVELVGGYFHIRPRSQYHAQPGANDRGSRVEVRRAG